MENEREKYALKKEQIVRSICFLVIFAMLFMCIQEIFTPKWLYVPGGCEGDTQRYQNFYELDRDSLDYIVLGTSVSIYAINPMLIYSETGYTGYNFGGTHQGIKVSLYWLKEALKYQKPKYVFYDVKSLLYESAVSSSDTYDAGVTKELTYMRFSWNKIQACLECRTKNKKPIEYLIPMLSFHDRWGELNKNDFYQETGSYPFKGTYLTFKIRNDSGKEVRNVSEYQKYDMQNKEIQYEKTNVSEENRKAFEEMVLLCRANGVEFIPICSLTKSIGTTEKNTLIEFLNEYGLQYVDLRNEVPIDWDKDTPDTGNHANYWGNSKYSHVLADYLRMREDGNASNIIVQQLWNDDLIEYRSFEKEKLINNKEKVLSYLNTLTQNKEELYIILSVRDEACGGWNEELDYYIRKLGLESDFRNNIQNSCIAVVDGGNCIFEQWAENKMVLEDSIILNEKNRNLSVTSAGFVYGDTAMIKLDSSNYSVNSRGLNIVAVEKATGKVISSVSIDTHESDASIKVKQLDSYAVAKWEEYKARAQQISNGVYVILPSNNEQCALNIEAGSEQEDVNLELLTRTEEISQQFEVEYAGSGLYYIKALCSDKYLTAHNYGNTNGTNVVQNSFTGLANQKWFIYESGEGVYTIMSHYNKLVMDVTGTVSEPGVNIQLYEENDGEWQKFIFAECKGE